MQEDNFAIPKDNLGLSVIAAFVAAIIGGIIWSVITIATHTEIAIIAWGIGGLTGYAVSIPSKDNITSVHKIVAVLTSLLGIALGKYIFFSNQYNSGLNGLFNDFDVFFKTLGIYFGYMDILFGILAVATAWQIPSQFNAPPESELTEDMIKSEAELNKEMVQDDHELNEDQQIRK